MSRNNSISLMFVCTTVMYVFVKGADDDATTRVFSRRCCEVNGTAVKAVCGGLPNLRKYYFLYIVKTNIPLGFIINFWFARSDSEKNCAI